MTNPPSWRPQGSEEAIGLGVASAGRSMPRPLPGKVMASLAGAIVAALGIAGYAASDFLYVDRTETASIVNDAAVAGGDAAKQVAMKPIAPAAKTDISGATTMAAAAQTLPPNPAKAPVASPVVEAPPHPAASKDANSVSSELRKEITPTMVTSTVFKQPVSAAHIAGLSPDVAVAESEAEVAKLEEQAGMGEPVPESEMEIARLERAASPSEAALTQEGGDTAAIGGPYIPVPGDLRATRVTRYVNLRDGPADEAKVIAVIPTNATVQAETNCGWCAVTYNGQSGYIYKGFLSGRGGGEKTAGGRSRAAKKLTGKPGLY